MGFFALVEPDGKKILYDTGAWPNTILQNAKDLGLDLSDVQSVGSKSAGASTSPWRNSTWASSACKAFICARCKRLFSRSTPSTRPRPQKLSTR